MEEAQKEKADWNALQAEEDDQEKPKVQPKQQRQKRADDGFVTVKDKSELQVRPNAKRNNKPRENRNNAKDNQNK